MESSPLSVNPSSKKTREDTFRRLSLAVRELEKLITRANQLAYHSEQPLHLDQSNQPDQSTLPQKT